jgi:polyisoprenoid-binding protein YceI
MFRHTFAAAALAVSGVATAAQYTIDPAHTYPNFSITHLGFSTIHGRFNTTAGTLDYDPENKAGSVEIIIDASSIDTGHEKRDEHLRSPDFLNVVEFPEITFKSTAVEFNGDNIAKVSGDLTILGVSKPVDLEVTHANCATHPMNNKPTCGFDATATIKRSDFGVNYGIPNLGDEMTLVFGVEAAQE